MILSILRNIGLSQLRGKDPIDIVLDAQRQKLRNIKHIFVCSIEFNPDHFKLSVEEFDPDRLKEYLPGSRNPLPYQ